MRSKKSLIPVLVLVLTVISIYSLIRSNTETIREYDSTLKTAREYASQGIVDDAVKYYEKALDYKEDADTYIEYVNVYVDNGYDRKALRVAEEMVQKTKDPKAYECLLDRYMAMKAYEDCFDLNDEATKKKLKTKAFSEKMKTIEYQYEQDYYRYSEVNNFSGGLTMVKDGERCNLLDETGKVVLRTDYKEIGYFSYYSNKKNKDDSSWVTPVCTSDGDWFYIASTGNKKIESDKDLKIDKLGLYNEKLIAVSVKGKYAYYNDKFEKQFGDYLFAGNFNCGRAAVEEAENEWYIINEKGEKLNQTPYLDVILDAKDMAFRNDRAFVLIDGDYYLIDVNCNKVSDQKFVDAQLFLNTEGADMGPVLAAVCFERKWGFIDVDGNVVIEPQYMDAHAFSYGFAAVQAGGQWGFIDANGDLVIDYTFHNVKDFNSKGNVFVNYSKGWILIKLFKFNH